MDYKDYYKILGVSPEADDKTIKRAYRDLAKKYHPDQNPNDKSAEAKFKEVSEAYQAVSDPAKRRKYDSLRQDYESWQRYGARDSFDWSAWGQPGAENYRAMSEEDLARFFGSAAFENDSSFGGFSDFFSMLFGFGNGNDKPRSRRNTVGEDFFGRRSAQPRDGYDLEGEIVISLEEAYNGGPRRVEVNGKVLEAQIPQGVADGARIRLTGQGEPGSNGGRTGDLLLKILIEEHPGLRREGNHLRTTVDIDFYTAVLGGEISVKGLGQSHADNRFSIKIPPRTQSGKTFRLKGKGMPVLNKKNQYGDLYVQAVIALPQDLSEAEVRKIRELAQRFDRA
ncbi:MAG: DnaJ domain-containing protein [Peptococcaceae bacterium]|nr:DnaJ domain-containing protein [Peptococcaceae bacterium]